MSNVKIEEHQIETSGIYDLTEAKTQRQINADLKGSLNTVCLQAGVQPVSATNGTSSWITLTGLTANHVVGNWGMFSDATCTTAIAENSPPCDITIETGANQWRYTTANNSTAFYLRPTFILKQN